MLKNFSLLTLLTILKLTIEENIYINKIKEFKEITENNNNKLSETNSQNCNAAQAPLNIGKCNLAEMSCTDDTLTNCTCKPGYVPISSENKDSDFQYCKYKQKKQLVAFLLELFIGFGAGHFYRSAYGFAFKKLGAYLAAVCLICCLPGITKEISRNSGDCVAFLVTLIYYACSVGIGFWYVFDLIQFAKNNYPDNRFEPNIGLKPW